MTIRRPTLATLAVLALLSFNACSRDTPLTLSAPEALDKARKGEITLIDIRRPEEWRQTGVAEGVRRVNMIHPAGPQGFIDAVLREVGGRRDAPIALICRTGNRTGQMRKFLEAQGFTQVYHVAEGMAGSAAGPGWIRRGLPVESCARC